MEYYVGWVKGNSTNFIVATTLARHKKITRKIESKPFVFTWDTIGEKLSEDGYYYIVGSFERDELNTIFKKNVKATIIGKIYDSRYGSKEKVFRVGRIKVYPVPKKATYGLEYLAVLMIYFNVSRETKFFTTMLEYRYELARILNITEAWEEAFNLLTTFEVVDNPDPNDIARTLEYIKKKYNFYSKLERIVLRVRRSVVYNVKGGVVIDLGDEENIKKYSIAAQRTFPRKKVIVLIGKDEHGVKVSFAFRKPITYALRKAIATKFKTKKVKGGLIRFTLYPMINDREMITRTAVSTISFLL